MKKRILALAMAAVMAGSLTACSGSSGTDTKAAPAETEAPASESKSEAKEESKAGEGDAANTASSKGGSEGYELALVTDLGTIDDKSFNQGAWEGLKKYAEENSIAYKYYQPQEGTTDSYLETIGLAIEGGAKLVVCPGFLFEEPIYLAQDKYPDVHFILLDGEPHDADYNYKTNDNVMPILFQEDQAGFLAGYAVVKDGYTKLGFMGGMAVPAVIRFGYGFVQGAEFAAEEDGITGLEIMYNYTGAFSATPEAQSMAASWYQNGTEVIFGCGGAVGNSVMAAAQEKNAKVIGVDVDQSANIDTYGEGMCVTSAMKGLAETVKHMLGEVVAGNFANYGGQVETLGLVNGDDPTANYVQLPMETTQWGDGFTQDDYKALVKAMYDGDVTVSNDISAMPATTITVNFAGNIK